MLNSATGGTRTYFKRLLDIHKKNNIITKAIINEKKADEEIKKYITDCGVSFVEVRERIGLERKLYFSILYEFKVYRKIIKSFAPDIVITTCGSPAYEFYIFLQKNRLYIYFTYMS